MDKTLYRHKWVFDSENSQQIANEEKELSEFRKRYAREIVSGWYETILQEELKSGIRWKFFTLEAEDRLVHDYLNPYSEYTREMLIRDLRALHKLHGQGESKKSENYLAIIDRTKKLYDKCREGINDGKRPRT